MGVEQSRYQEQKKEEKVQTLKKIESLPKGLRTLHDEEFKAFIKRNSIHLTEL